VVHRLRALLFDLDGTLLDSSNAICDAAAEGLNVLGADVRASDIDPLLGAPLTELYERFIGDGDDERMQRFVQLYIEFHDRHPEADPPPLPGVADGLKRLDARYGHRMGVATTKPTQRALRQIQVSGIAHHFHHVQGTDEGMTPKPHPDVIHRACAELEVDPRDVLMVGDTERDIHAARRAGAFAIAVAYSDAHYTRAKTFGADRVVRSLEELVDFELE
jgi:phosphoglycolate phosphatase